MDATNDSARVLLFPSCDRGGLLLDALARGDDEPATRADAMLFGWMLGLDATIDAVGAARAVLAVAVRQSDPPPTAYRRALIEGLERFIADRGRVASLSTLSRSASVRPRRRWREAFTDGARTDDVVRPGRGDSREDPDGQRTTRS